jgi:hypothetical protein
MEYIEQFRIPSKEPASGSYGLSHSFRLHWDINTICDKNCFYCYAREQLKWNELSSKPILDNILEQLKNINKPLEVILLGGEPSMHPLYFYVLRELEKIDHLKCSAVLSNCGKMVNYKWIDRHSQFKKFWFNFSFHPSETNDLDDYTSKILYAKKQGYNVLVHVLLVGHAWDDKISHIVNFCHDNNIHMKPNVLYTPKDSSDYLNKSEKYKQWIAKYSDKFEKYLYFSKKQLERNIPGNQSLQNLTLDTDYILLNDIDVYLNDLNKFKGWKCLQNNYVVEGSNNAKIMRMCDNTQTGEYMICPLERCMCQGLLTNEKFKI